MPTRRMAIQLVTFVSPYVVAGRMSSRSKPMTTRAWRAALAPDAEMRISSAIVASTGMAQARDGFAVSNAKAASAMSA